MRFLIYTLVLVTVTNLVTAVDMETVHMWKYIDYLWNSEDMKQQAIKSGDYNYTQVLPMDVDQAPDGRLFVSLLGIKGVPAVLGTVTGRNSRSGPLIKPYPDWSYFKKGDCNYMQNIYRIAIDECERLWVLDTGSREETENETMQVKCEPKLFVFDLKTDRLINKIIISDEYGIGSNNLTLLVTPIVETNGWDCSDTTVYMVDVFGQGLVIWNNGKLSRLEHSVFGPSEGAENITSGGFTIQWNTGIVTMDLSPKLFLNEPRALYFHSLASFDLNWADAKSIKRSADGSDVEYFGVKNVLSSQAVGVAFSSEGTFFMGLTKESGIACWNRYRPLKPANIEIVARDNKRLQYINGMKTVRNPRTGEEELLVLSNRLLAAEFDQLDFKDYNFHILKRPVKELVADTECELPFNIRSMKYSGDTSSIEDYNSRESSIIDYSNGYDSNTYDDYSFSPSNMIHQSYGWYN